jgi:NADH-quinone oxidoreductase subunit J
MVINFLFFVFSFLILLSSLMVVVVQNSVYSVLFLVLSFVSSAGLLLIFECEFLALMFVIVYVGAIAVLFLFIVMMLDIKIVSSNKDTIKYFPVGLILGSIFSLEILVIVNENFKKNFYSSSVNNNYYVNWFDKLDKFSDIESLGQLIFTQYVLQFLIAGNILLLATIAVVVLTINTNSKQKTQNIFKQISRTHKNVLLLT